MAKINTLDIRPTGKVIVVTGGYGHLGTAICASLLKSGAIVYVAARDQEKFKSVFTEELKASEERLHYLKCNINSTKSITSAFQELMNIEGRLDGLINNAFGSRGQSPYKMSREDFNYTLDGSLTSIFDSIKLAIPHLSEGACIINVSSMYGIVAPDFNAYKENPGYLNPPHYGAAKAGVIQLSKYYASLLGDRGIRVNTVTPGPFPSYQVQKDELFIAQLRSRTLLGRIGLPEELAGIFTFLMSDAAKFITGQNFVIDGGWTTT
jgi:NAD(P)-dependent dehydrogenase (short-subunit alcohol dehydrogenase family)